MESSPKEIISIIFRFAAADLSTFRSLSSINNRWASIAHSQRDDLQNIYSTPRTISGTLDDDIVESPWQLSIEWSAFENGVPHGQEKRKFSFLHYPCFDYILERSWKAGKKDGVEKIIVDRNFSITDHVIMKRTWNEGELLSEEWCTDHDSLWEIKTRTKSEDLKLAFSHKLIESFDSIERLEYNKYI